MKVFEYQCSRCPAVRLFTEEQHAILESVIGGYLRERRALRLHQEPTPEDGGPPQLGNCVGALQHSRTFEATLIG